MCFRQVNLPRAMNISTGLGRTGGWTAVSGVRTSLVIRILAAYWGVFWWRISPYLTTTVKLGEVVCCVFCCSYWLIDMNVVSETKAPFPISEGSSLRHTHVKQRIPKKVDIKKSFLFTHKCHNVPENYVQIFASNFFCKLLPWKLTCPLTTNGWKMYSLLK